jgi:hypothetical protein
LATLAGCSADDAGKNAAPGVTDDGGAIDADAAPDQAADATADRGTDASDAARDAGEGITGMGIFAGSVGTSAVKLVAFDFAKGEVAGSATISASFADAAPTAGIGRGFLMLRSDGKVLVLHAAQPWVAKQTIDFNEADAGAGPNPRAVVDTGEKAYVALYGANRLAIIDPTAGTVTGQVDLSAFVDPSDPDGLVDVFDGVYDASKRRAYFLLQRTDQYEWGIAPDFVNTCGPAAPLVIGVDATTDAVVDLNGAADGKGVALLGKNPGALTPDLEHGRLLVVEAGCHDPQDVDAGSDAGAAPARHGRGIEAVDLASGTSAWLYQHAQPERLDNVVLIDEAHAFVSVADSTFTPHWFAWDPRTATLGPETPAVPRYWPRHLGGGTLVGTTEAQTDAGGVRSIVSFDVTTNAVTSIAADIYDGSGASEFSPWALLP